MNKKNSKVNLLIVARHIIQLAFFVMLMAGVYMDLRMILMVLFPASLLFGNFFCGWVCPYGAVQEFFSGIGRKLFKKRYRMPRRIQKYARFLRYILFAILMIGVADIVLTPMNGYLSFMKAFTEGLKPFAVTAAAGIMMFYVILSLFFERAFCNYLCTEAAKYGVVSMARIFSIKRREETCVNCNKCDKACPMNIEVSAHAHVRNGQCINCMECIGACPVKGTLSYGFVKWPVKRKK